MRKIFMILFLSALLIFSACSNVSNEEHIHDDTHPHEEMMKSDVVVREVNVQAKQWEFIVDNGESQSLNEIRVKKGERVNLKANTLDMEHGIGIIGYNVNMNINPGEETEKSFLADKEGEYDFVCTQYCGKGHMMHKGKFIVEE